MVGQTQIATEINTAAMTEASTTMEPTTTTEAERKFDRAAGCLAGQFCGDAYGAQYEFMGKAKIASLMRDNGTDMMGASKVWHTEPGQITDDSEMAVSLARSMIDGGGYKASAATKYYLEWSNSEPFDIGATCLNGLRGYPNCESQANGALMRISTLAVHFAYNNGEGWEDCDKYAAADAKITHPNDICVQANILFVRALVELISSAVSPRELNKDMCGWAAEISAHECLRSVVAAADHAAPSDYITKQGWVVIAFQNAIYQLLHAASPMEGIIDTVSCGGDTDTNAAIAGAMLGAHYGYEAFPKDWLATVQECRPGGLRPRPKAYWVGDIKELTKKTAVVK